MSRHLGLGGGGGWAKTSGLLLPRSMLHHGRGETRKFLPGIRPQDSDGWCVRTVVWWQQLQVSSDCCQLAPAAIGWRPSAAGWQPTNSYWPEGGS